MAKEGTRPVKKGLEDVTDRTTSRLSGKIDADAARMQSAITSLEKKIIADASALQTGPNGNLLSPKVNLKQAQKLHTKLTTMFDETYGSAIRSSVSGYGDVENWILQNFNDLDVAAKWTDIDRTMISQLKQQKVIEFMSLGEDAQARVTQALYNNIAAMAPIDNLIGEISAALTGSYSVSGKPLSQYAALYANDAVMNFYNAVSIDKGIQLGMEYFLYSGTVMGNTRDFCSRRVGKAYSVEQINSWTHNWAGKRGPAMTYRGGWNCRHHWTPVREEWLPEGGIDVTQWGKMSIPDRFAEMAKRGMAMSPDEKLFKKRLNQLRYNVKSGKPFKVNSNLGKMWFNIPDHERSKLIKNWQDAGLKLPKEMLMDLVADMPPADFVKIPGTIVPDAPTPVKLPKKVPKTPKTPKIKPETKVTPPPDVDSYPGGLQWDELDAKQKKSMGQLGYNLKVGKKWNPNSQPAKTWDLMSYEAQQMKLKGWKAKGFEIPPNMPIKGEGQVLANLTDDIAEGVSVWDNNDLGVLSDEFKDKFKFKQGVGAEGYGGIPAVEVETIQELGRHWDGMLTRHSKIGNILDEAAAQGIDSGQGIIIHNAKNIPSGAAGVYGDTTGVMQLAGDLKRVDSLYINKGGWTVADDFYSVSRHEFGHYLDNTLRKLQDWPSKTSTKYLGWNHQSEWRKLYKKHQNQWETLVGRYSAQDKYEGFAEVFSAYTSPKYQKGMLPKDIEDYMEKLIGGRGGKVVRPPKPVKPPGDAIFADADHEKLYNTYFNRYRNMKLDASQIREEIRNKCPNIDKVLHAWQGTTQQTRTYALKLKAELLEARDDIKFFARAGAYVDMNDVKKWADKLPDDEYIRIRALNQEYYDRQGITKKKLYRGTDGQNSGPRFRNQVNEIKSKVDENDWDKVEVEFTEPSLTGWSTSRSKANSFGANGAGITAEVDIPIRDVFISDELWPKTIYKSEYEWVVLRSEKQSYRLKDIRSNFGYWKNKTPDVPIEPVKQEVLDKIQKLPSKIKPGGQEKKAVILYIQNIKGWKTMDTETLIAKLQKKRDGIKKALDQGKDVYIFPGKSAESSVLTEFNKAIMTINKSYKSDWIEQVEKFKPGLFKGDAIKTTEGLSKKLYNIADDAQPLPQFITNTTQMKTLLVKQIDDFDWKKVPPSEVADELIGELLHVEQLIEEGGKIEILGHQIAGDVADDYKSMLENVISTIEDKNDISDLVQNTTLLYY